VVSERERQRLEAWQRQQAAGPAALTPGTSSGELTVSQQILVWLYTHRDERKTEYTIPATVTQEGIADGIGKSRAHVALELAALEKRGLVHEMPPRHPLPDGRARRSWELTDEGYRVAAELAKARSSSSSNPIDKSEILSKIDDAINDEKIGISAYGRLAAMLHRADKHDLAEVIDKIIVEESEHWKMVQALKDALVKSNPGPEVTVTKYPAPARRRPTLYAITMPSGERVTCRWRREFICEPSTCPAASSGSCPRRSGEASPSACTAEREYFADFACASEFYAKKRGEGYSSSMEWDETTGKWAVYWWRD